MITTDFYGNLLGQFDYLDELGLFSPVELAAITTGRDAGAFSVIDGRDGRVIFKLK